MVNPSSSFGHVSDQRRNYLAIMGIESWERRMNGTMQSRKEIISSSMPATSAAIPDVDVNSPDEVASMGWEALEQAVQDCTACPLHRVRTRDIFGIGNRATQWLIVSDVPGVDQNQLCKFFTDREEQLLYQMLHGIGLRHEEVYLTSIIKSCLPANRTLAPAEAAACRPYLERQIELIHPRIILAVGAVAAQNLLRTTTPIGLLRGRVYRHGTIRVPMIVTYHPSYLLRDCHEKAKAWDDLRLAWRVFHRIPPDGQDF
ncbi:uracil-DNA glycosylase [Gammaproteobacteria bacterium]